MSLAPSFRLMNRTAEPAFSIASMAELFALPDAHDGFCADFGITDVGGFADAAVDQTGNGNTLTAPSGTQRPEIIASWRNGRTALLGRTQGTIVCLRRTSHANGALAQPMTRYTVGSVTTGSSRHQVIGWNQNCSTFAVSGTERLSMRGGTTGLIFIDTDVADGTPYIQRDVINEAGVSHMRVEVDGASPYLKDDSALPQVSPGSYDGITWLSYPNANAGNWIGHGAFFVDFSGNVPADEPAVDAAILAFLRSYYDIHGL